MTQSPQFGRNRRPRLTRADHNYVHFANPSGRCLLQSLYLHKKKTQREGEIL